MYYKKNGNVIRDSGEQNTPKVKEDFKEDLNQILNNSSSNSDKFPMWALILIIVALIVLGISIVLWVWFK